ncbi:MAG: hypothetical protein HYX33_01205 [Actinobacteria bacterium]|nr:hypothetical protein [Actinomycetota bacterium]
MFRTLAAPGLDEDDLFAALHGLPGTGAFWGEGLPTAFSAPEPSWDEAAARRERHERVLRRWTAEDPKTAR